MHILIFYNNPSRRNSYKITNSYIIKKKKDKGGDEIGKKKYVEVEEKVIYIYHKHVTR